MLARRALLSSLAVLAGVALSACGGGPQGIELDRDEVAGVQRGAILFAERCSGCHTLDAAGAEGSATSINDRERVDGPNFNVRCVSEDNAMYAIRNGGYSGAIMPENILVGRDAEQVAQFLEKYAGRQAGAGCEQ